MKASLPPRQGLRHHHPLELPPDDAVLEDGCLPGRRQHSGDQACPGGCGHGPGPTGLEHMGGGRPQAPSTPTCPTTPHGQGGEGSAGDGSLRGPTLRADLVCLGLGAGSGWPDRVQPLSEHPHLFHISPPVDPRTQALGSEPGASTVKAGASNPKHLGEVPMCPPPGLLREAT